MKKSRLEKWIYSLLIGGKAVNLHLKSSTSHFIYGTTQKKDRQDPCVMESHGRA